jgi:hypothetical protein
MIISFSLFILSLFSDTTPKGAQKLIDNYPGIVVSYKDNYLYFKDGTSMIYDDKKIKTKNELINSPDIQDQFTYKYNVGDLKENPINDPGRIRNEAFFKKIYGNSAQDVKNNLVSVNWCPKLIGQKILVTKTNQVNKQLEKISKELEELPEFKEYLQNIGGTFNWRLINGTKRLSMHSFGMTIDINTKFSDYWQWSCGCTNEDIPIKKYKNRIPMKIVAIFEKHGFIWGGKWEHFDTMHFEYRPELTN